MTDKPSSSNKTLTNINNNNTNRHARRLECTPLWLQNRERGLSPSSGVGVGSIARLRARPSAGLKHDRARILDDMLTKLYSRFSAHSILETALQRGFGSIFNLDFSPDGNVVLAACERRAMILFDPLTSKTICTIPNAHSDCVNCIKFFDSRIFASGSDDNTIALWDVRNLKSMLRSFEGHTNWVKSIEYCRNRGLMISSAFDGNVFSWDINKYVTNSDVPLYNCLLNISALMRMRITPDGDKMVVSSASGLYVIIHDLDLPHLRNDMEGFQPRHYVRSGSDETEKNVSQPTHLFYRKRNRVEIVNDFPNASTGEELCISSLVMHPQGWCMVSRLSTENDNLEYTCVHDVQDSGSTIATLTKAREFFSKHCCYKAYEPTERLLYHMNEPSDGKGYIKELSMSPDGRLICSSFGYGVRLLAFDTGMSELCDVQSSSPSELHEMKTMYNHRQTVLTSAFSPTQCLLATGCLNGRVVFYHPRL